MSTSRKLPLTTLRTISEINLTPLMDLTFILLITFIITFPLIEQGIPVNLPKGKARELQPDESITVSIDAAGRLYLDNLLMPLETLQDRVSAMATGDSRLTVMIRADRQLPYGDVVGVLRALHDVNVTRIALVTQDEGRGTP